MPKGKPLGLTAPHRQLFFELWEMGYSDHQMAQLMSAHTSDLWTVHRVDHMRRRYGFKRVRHKTPAGGFKRPNQTQRQPADTRKFARLIRSLPVTGYDRPWPA